MSDSVERLSAAEVIQAIRELCDEHGLEGVAFVGASCEHCGIDIDVPLAEIDEFEARLEAHIGVCPATEATRE